MMDFLKAKSFSKVVSQGLLRARSTSLLKIIFILYLKKIDLKVFGAHYLSLLLPQEAQLWLVAISGWVRFD